MTRAKGLAPFAILALLLVGVGSWLALRGDATPPPGHDHVDPGVPTSRGEAPATSRSTATTQAVAARPMRLRVVDVETRAGLAGARLCDGRDAKVIATTDGEGAATFAVNGLRTLVIARSGYLLRLFDPGPEARAVEEIALRPDLGTLPREVHFVTASGAPAREVAFGVTCRDEPPPLGGTVRGDTSPEARAAWAEHQTLAITPRFASLLDEHLHFGIQSDHARYRCGAATVVRFCASGRYALEAVSADGETARVEFTVTGPRDPPLVVRLVAGLFLEGVVVDGEGAPLAGATLSDVSEDRGHTVPLVLGASGADGRFRCGPLTDVVLPLGIAHPDCEARRLEAVRPGTGPLRIVLVRHPRRSVVGIVRARPRLEPVAAASVSLVDASGTALVLGTSDGEGRFTLRTSAPEATLVVEAKGRVTYKEVVTTETTDLLCDLLPDDRNVRVAAGLTAVLAGRVLDAAGQAAPGAQVVVVPDRPVARIGVPGRRILRGAVLELASSVVCGADGTFELESDQLGTARLLVPGSGDGIPVTITLGTRLSDLTLRTAR